MVRKQLQGLGHGTGIDRKLIPEELVEIFSSTFNHTAAMRHERALVRAILTPEGFTEAVTFAKDELETIRAPILMVYGSEDPVGSEELWEQFVSGLPNGSLHVVPDTGHLPWYDHPDEVADRVTAHLASP